MSVFVRERMWLDRYLCGCNLVSLPPLDLNEEGVNFLEFDGKMLDR